MRRSTRLLSGTAATALLMAAFAVGDAWAQLPDAGAGTDQPAVITADELLYDDELEIVVARGNVEISQGGRLLRADRVTYNRASRIVTASGNVVLRETGGELLFAEYAELDDELSQGFIERVGILFPDDSRVAAVGGVRREDRLTEVDRAVYSPCDLCEEDPERAPLWRLRAARVTHDSERKDVIYRDAFLDLFGIPVFYTPYLSHPDPTVEQRTGFLTPSFGSTATLGPFAYNYFYWGIASDKDATFTLGATRDAGILLGAEYRQRFADGEIFIEGSVNQSDRQDLQNGQTVTVEDEGRYHLFSDIRYNFNENWRAGADIRLVSDDTYLDVFEISGADELTSRAYLERFDFLDYFAVEAYSIRDLRSDAIEQPVMLPWVTLHQVGEPGGLLGGHWYLDAEFIALTRDEEVPLNRRTDTEGLDTRRASVETGWQRTVTFDTGLVTDLKALTRATVWWSDDLSDPTGKTPVRDDVAASRFYPLVLAEARYPLLRDYNGYQHLIEPIVGLRLAASIDSDPQDIPNNDSVSPEFDEINLFSESVFSGIDRVEDGVTAIYGMRTGLFAPDGAFATLFLGQQYRFDNDPDLPAGIGVDDEYSDVVGRLRIRPRTWFDIDWRFRVDPDEWDLRRSEVAASVSLPKLFLSSTYTFVDETQATGFVQPGREELALYATSPISRYWTATGSLTRDLAVDQNRLVTAGLTYQDECFTFSALVEQDLTVDRDRESGTSIFLRIAFRNLGELPIGLGGASSSD